MKIEPVITYRNIDKTAKIDNLIQEKISKLEMYCDYMNSCHVVIEKANEHPSSGSPYRVSIDITIPHNREIAVIESPDRGKQYPPLEAVIRDAFEAARRQIVSISTEQKGERKVHPEQNMGALVVKLFPEEGYGFIKAIDTGTEIYFHKNSVIDNDFDRLEVGVGVRYKETMGDMGPQATTVKIVDKQGSHQESDNTPSEAETPLGWD